MKIWVYFKLKKLHPPRCGKTTKIWSFKFFFLKCGFRNKIGSNTNTKIEPYYRFPIPKPGFEVSVAHYVTGSLFQTLLKCPVFKKGIRHRHIIGWTKKEIWKFGKNKTFIKLRYCRKTKISKSQMGDFFFQIFVAFLRKLKQNNPCLQKRVPES